MAISRFGESVSGIADDLNYLIPRSVFLLPALERELRPVGLRVPEAFNRTLTVAFNERAFDLDKLDSVRCPSNFVIHEDRSSNVKVGSVFHVRKSQRNSLELIRQDFAGSLLSFKP